MSERGRNDREPDERTLPGATRGKPGPVHEALYNKIMEECLKMVQEYAPKFGEVRGMDGGRVKVRVDGESADRDVGLVRKRGERYNRGDRVKVGKTSTGEEYVEGTYGSKDGRDPAVGNEDLHDDAVDDKVLAANSVTKGNNALGQGAVARGNIENKAIGKEQLDTNAVDRNAIGNKAVGSDQIDGGAIQPGHLSQDVKNDFASDNHGHSDYADKNHNHNYAENNHSHGEYAKETHNHKIADISGLETRLKKLEDSVKKKSGS